MFWLLLITEATTLMVSTALVGQHFLFDLYFYLFLYVSEMYIQDASSGICESNAEPEIINSKFATAFVDGKNSLGPVVGNFCMKLAIEKAKQFGVGWVAANSEFP